MNTNFITLYDPVENLGCAIAQFLSFIHARIGQANAIVPMYVDISVQQFYSVCHMLNIRNKLALLPAVTLKYNFLFIGKT